MPLDEYVNGIKVFGNPLLRGILLFNNFPPDCVWDGFAGQHVFAEKTLVSLTKGQPRCLLFTS